MKLSDADLALIQVIEAKRALVRKRVQSVAERYSSAFFIYGPGGHGKSHAVEEQLNQFPGVNKWQHYNSEMTAKGLVEILETFPDRLHFLEDMETVFKDPKAQGVLRSACGRPGGGDRIITWTTAKQRIRFPFTGGIIIASNQAMDTYGNLGALASRFSPLEWKLTEPELAAAMRQIALGGWSIRGKSTTTNPNKKATKPRNSKRKPTTLAPEVDSPASEAESRPQRKSYTLSPAECWEVAEFLIGEMEAKKRNTKVDLRTYCDGALPDMLHRKNDSTGVHWQDVVRSRIHGEASSASPTRAENNAVNRQIACEVYLDGNNTTERITLWTNRTGLKKEPFYDRLKEAKQSGLFEQIKATRKP